MRHRTVIRAIYWALLPCILLIANTGFATDRGVSWGAQLSATSSSAAFSATNHLRDSQTAVTNSGGRDTLLPGATLNSVGVLNEINVVGDNNLVEATQTGTNTGDVSTTINVQD